MSLEDCLMGTTQASINGWINKEVMGYTHTHTDIHTHTLENYSAIKNKTKHGNPTICENMDGTWKALC